MSQKKIRMPNNMPTPFDNLKLAPEITEIPDEYVVKVAERGSHIYGEAIHSLVRRFAGSKLQGKPEVLVQNAIHQVIAFMAQLIPLDAGGRPVEGPELAAIFGAAVGMAAASAVDKGQASIAEVESMVDVYYVALREAIPRGISIVRAVDAQMSGSPKHIIN